MTTNRHFDVSKVERTARKFRIVTHPDRYRIIQLLDEKKELNVTQIYEALELKQAETSHHTTMMLEYGIVKKVRRGKESIYTINTEVIEKIMEYTEVLVKRS
jgi:DNA-binding transcriptional ArsR family regulator